MGCLERQVCVGKGQASQIRKSRHCQQQSASIQPIVQNAIDSFVRSSEDGIQKTQQRLREFEWKYLMSTDDFIERYENDELDETLEFGEWIGESLMLQGMTHRPSQTP
jgi:hypothetical protein